MKKFFLFVTGILFIMIFVACDNVSTTTSTTTLSTTSTTTETTTQSTTTTTESTTSTTTETTTLSQLSMPTNIQVIDNTITFDVVANAEKYRIRIFDSTDTLVGEYNISNGFDLSLLLAYGTYSYQLWATANNYLASEKTEKTNFEIMNPNQTNILEGSEMNNLEYIRWLGRTYYDEVEEAKYFYFTASGFEIAFYGTELKVTLKASNYNNTGKQPYVVALVDGEEDPTQGTTFILNQEEAEYTIVSGLEYGYHTVKLLKRSEAIDSDTAVKAINTDGYFTTPPQAKSFSIQFIAASSSTGFGNLGTVNESKTSANSDGLRAFAYLTTFLLDSEISIFSASGWGVSRGWNTSGNISETQNIPNAFEYTAIDASNYVFTEGGKWDISNFVPDVIVVNLGTNDFNASNYRTMSTLDKLALEERFYNDYTDFLVLLNNMYPDAFIIVAYGLMNEQTLLEDITLEIINGANATIGETKVYAFEMEGAGTLGNPYGCSYHPNVQTSMNVAESLADFISSITGRAVVREMIE